MTTIIILERPLKPILLRLRNIFKPYCGIFFHDFAKKVYFRRKYTMTRQILRLKEAQPLLQTVHEDLLLVIQSAFR